MPPKKELFRPFESKLVVRRSGSRDVDVLEWKQIENRGFFRPSGASPEIVWCYADIRLHRLRHIYRVVPLNELGEVPTRSWLLCNMKAQGVILEDSKRGANWKLSFDWPGVPLAFLQAPLQFFIESAAQTIRENTAEWERVSKWAYDDEGSCFWAQVSWKRGSQQEWLLLVRALFQMALLKSNASGLKGWPIFVMQRPNHNFSLLRMSKSRFYSPRIWELLACAEKYFEARVDHRLFGTLSLSAFHFYWYPPPISAEKPTQHELIEAIELWREFGRKSGQLSQVEACLRQLLK